LLASIGFWIYQSRAQGRTAAEPVPQATAPLATRIVAYYFHGTQRCYTCLTMESYASDALNGSFSQELSTGRVQFQSVNIEEPANQHFWDDYQLSSQALVLVAYRDGQQVTWNNLAEIWSKVRDKEQYYQYVKDGMTQLLAEVR